MAHKDELDPYHKSMSQKFRDLERSRCEETHHMDYDVGFEEDEDDGYEDEYDEGTYDDPDNEGNDDDGESLQSQPPSNERKRWTRREDNLL